MHINIVDSNFMFKKNVWSVNFLMPKETLKVANGYKLIPLGDLVTEKRDNRLISDDEINVRYVGLENIEPQTGRLVDYVPKNGYEIKSSCKLFRRGDILFGRLRPNLNKVLYNDILDDGVCSTEIIVLVPNENAVNPCYLSEILRTEKINSQIIKMVKGAALPRISMSDLKHLEVPIPSLQVQNELSNIISGKRNELEIHIRMAKQIPQDIGRLLTDAYSFA